MSAVAESIDTTTSDDPFAGITIEMLTTPRAEPVAETPTPEAEPVSTPEASGEQADTPQAGRDGRGRFAPKEGEAEAAPTETTPATEPEPDWRAEVTKLQRQLQTTHANVDNAAKQAAANARQEALAEAERNERQRITRILDEHQRNGDDVSQARQQWQAQWDEQDRTKRAQEDNQRQAGLMLSEVASEAKEMLMTLYGHGTAELAKDTGLTHDEARGLWDEQDERDRFLRAAMQSKTATKMPGLLANASALEDYMGTMVNTANKIAAVKKQYAGALAAKDKEIAKLTQELNRTEAADIPNETPARGGTGRRKASNPDEHATNVLNDNLGEFAQAFGLHR